MASRATGKAEEQQWKLGAARLPHVDHPADDEHEHRELHDEHAKPNRDRAFTWRSERAADDQPFEHQVPEIPDTECPKVPRTGRDRAELPLHRKESRKHQGDRQTDRPQANASAGIRQRQQHDRGDVDRRRVLREHHARGQRRIGRIPASGVSRLNTMKHDDRCDRQQEQERVRARLLRIPDVRGRDRHHQRCHRRRRSPAVIDGQPRGEHDGQEPADHRHHPHRDFRIPEDADPQEHQDVEHRRMEIRAQHADRGRHAAENDARGPDFVVPETFGEGRQAKQQRGGHSDPDQQVRAIRRRPKLPFQLAPLLRSIAQSCRAGAADSEAAADLCRSRSRSACA